jgi:hypothetical protein
MGFGKKRTASLRRIRGGISELGREGPFWCEAETMRTRM